MKPSEHLAHLLRLTDEIAAGNLIHLLSLDGFEAAARLAGTERLVRELGAFADAVCPGDERLRLIPRRNLAVVAQRLLLGRHHEALRRLRKLWEANGTPSGIVDLGIEAGEEAIRGWSPGASARQRLGTHAAFVVRLGEIEAADREGPLGRAVAQSVYRGAAGRSEPCLPAEERGVGFPVVLAGAPEGVRRSLWVEDFGEAWPFWTEGLEGEISGGVEEAARHWQRLKEEWQGLLWAPAEHKRIPCPCPEWLALPVLRLGCDSLRSADLALLLHWMAEEQGRTLPAGIGFTGRVEFPSPAWVRARVRGVSGVAAKLEAAREAGIFLLFAVHSPGEPCDLSPVPGIEVVWLEDGASLREVLRTINTECAERGLTEYRWRHVENQMREGRRPIHGDGSATPLLPDAADACPVGVVRRESELYKLRTTREQGRGRFALVLQGPPRSGKSTLLSAWLREAGDWPRRPVWFSFQRGRPGATTLEDLRASLVEQIEARFAILLESSHRMDTSASDAGPEEQARLLWRVGKETGARIDVMVDGLDEADANQQGAILDFLLKLPGEGVVVIGTQDDLPDSCLHAAKVVRVRPDDEVARAIIARFLSRFEESGKDELREIGRSLDVRYWRDGLAERCGGNPWVVTDFLRALEERRIDLPATLDETRLTPDVSRYCGEVWKGILGCYEPGVRPEVSRFAATLALLGECPWEIDAVLRAAGLPCSESDQHVWRGRLEGWLRRLVVSERGLVQLKDATFREFIGREYPKRAENLAERLPEFLREGDSEELRAWAVREGANLVLRAAERKPALVRQLLLESDWASLRLQSAAGDGRVGEMVTELRHLKNALKAEEKEELAVGRLFRALSAWQQHIEESGLDGACWWAALADLSENPVWARQHPPVAAKEPLLLLPAPRSPEEKAGYRTSPRVAKVLSGPACELPPADATCCPGEVPGKLLFAVKGGGLLAAEYDAAAGRYATPYRGFAATKGGIDKGVPLAEDGLR